MKRLIWLGLILVLLLPLAIASAQGDGEPPPPPVDTSPLDDAVQRALDAAAEAKEYADSASETAEEVSGSVDLALGLFGLFEGVTAVVGLVIPILVVVAGFVGLRRLNSAQDELDEVRDKFESQLEEYSSQFQTQMGEKEAELETLRSELRNEVLETVQTQREHTANALLAQSLLPLGERQYKAQDHDGALTTYHRALELDPNNPITHYRLGYVYVQTEDLVNAEKYFSKALELEEDFPLAMAGLGFVFRKMAEKMEKGKMERNRLMNQAESLMMAALDLSPRLIDDDGESWWGALGGLYRRRDQIEMAIDAYEKATNVTPQSSYGWGNLALLYTQKHDRERMLETYKKVERLAWAEAQSESANYWGYSDVVVARLALGKTEEIDDVLDTTLDLVSAEYQLGMLTDTLQRLQDVVEEEKKQSIKRAIAKIESYRQHRFPPQPPEDSTEKSAKPSKEAEAEPGQD